MVFVRLVDGQEKGRGFEQYGGCGTPWIPARHNYRCNNSCPVLRAQDNGVIAARKVKTFETWCREPSILPDATNIPKDGFDNGFTLARIRAGGARISDTEPVETDRAIAIRAGMPV